MQIAAAVFMARNLPIELPKSKRNRHRPARAKTKWIPGRCPPILAS
jgi:hypothetical protein